MKVCAPTISSPLPSVSSRCTMFSELFCNLQVSLMPSHGRNWHHVSSPRSLIQRLRTKSLRTLHPRRHRKCLQCLPTEILEDIFRLVCSDGREMAYRLALVSSNINALSRPARFDSITLTAGSAWQVHAFLESLANARNAAQSAGSTVPYVRHLRLSLVFFLEAHISDTFKEHPLLTAAFNHWETIRAQNLGQAPNDRAKKRWRKFIKGLAQKYHALVERTLQTVAPRVETLCLFGHGSTHHREFYQFECGKYPPGPFCVNLFPRLRELYFAGDEPHLINSDKSPALTTSPRPLWQSPFPVLKRLHIAAHATNRVNVRHWVVAAPALKDFRITLGLWDRVRKVPELFSSLIWVLGALRFRRSTPTSAYLPVFR